MDLKLNQDQLILKNTVRSFILKEFHDDYVRQLCVENKYPPEFDCKIGELGLFGLCFPERYGGADMGPIEVAIVIEQLSRFSIDFGMSYGLNLLGGLIILNFGTETQKNQLLPEMIKGNLSFSLGYYEQFLINDLNKINGLISIFDGILKTNVITFYSEKRNQDKNIILLPLRDKEEKLVFVLLPQNLMGEGETQDILGRDLLGLKKFTIEEMGCNEGQLLTKGEEIFDYTVNWMKFINTISCIGNMKTVINETIKYAKEREQFGKPIGTFQSLKHLIVDTKTMVDASRLFGYWLAWLIMKNNGKLANLLKEINMANGFVTKSYVNATNCGMQVMGGFGYMSESKMERYSRDSGMTSYYVEDAFLQKMTVAQVLYEETGKSNC